jgi:hypothetical protein
MSSKYYENYNVAILAFGQIGQASELSFNTLSKLNSKFICVLGDKSGITSVEYAAEKFGIRNICVHKAPLSDLKSLKLSIDSKEEYAEFGQERFVKLTTFKWFLIKQSLIKHREVDGVYFSDLDVLWVNMPNKKKTNQILKKGFVALQNDSRPNKNYYRYCTGVMYWKNCKKSVSVLDELYQIQLNNNLNNIFIPDEPTFNSWMFENNQKKLIRPFPKDKFVIGFKYFELFINKDRSIQNITCFHANYTIGEKSKFRRLYSIEKRINKEVNSLLPFVLEIVLKVKLKLRLLLWVFKK